ncbi:MAG: hypothetical protein KDC87_00670 [Planctomycetes bacterium]|nr:hypothetical protein [Planctomycetota bacterium]MCB9870027.1 hypothetical protein [Planctomycetota bacterium]
MTATRGLFGLGRLTTALFLLTLLVMPSCSSLLPKPTDDKDDALVQRPGKRATVYVAEGAFGMRSGNTGYTIKTTGPDGKQETRSVEVSFGGMWSRDSANALGLRFRDAMLNTGAFRVKGTPDGADLKLVAYLTDYNPRAESSSKTGQVGFWWWMYRWTPSFLRGMWGRASTSSTVAKAKMKIEVWDPKANELLATADGEGYSVGGKQAASGTAWTSMFTGGGGDSTEKSVDKDNALRRACVRAVNNLLTRVPASYFKHE